MQNAYKLFLITTVFLLPSFLSAENDVVLDPVAVSTSAVDSLDDDVVYSTTPAGSSFVRHLAFQFDEDVKLLSRMEKRGMGRSEIITLILVSQKSEKSLRDLARERLKDRPSLRSMAEKHDMNYADTLLLVRDIKELIEEKGDSDLPPPVFDKADVSESDQKTKKQSRKSKKKDLLPNEKN